MFIFCSMIITNIISIHALLAESDNRHPGYCAFIHNFYPRSPCGERQFVKQKFNSGSPFLSTLSLRRATALLRFQSFGFVISIHALLAESDSSSLKLFTDPLDFYPRSPCGERPGLGVGLYLVTEISIHALLAESDKSTSGVLRFYP